MGDPKAIGGEEGGLPGCFEGRGLAMLGVKYVEAAIPVPSD